MSAAGPPQGARPLGGSGEATRGGALAPPGRPRRSPPGGTARSELGGAYERHDCIGRRRSRRHRTRARRQGARRSRCFAQCAHPAHRASRRPRCSRRRGRAPARPACDDAARRRLACADRAAPSGMAGRRPRSRPRRPARRTARSCSIRCASRSTSRNAAKSTRCVAPLNKAALRAGGMQQEDELRWFASVLQHHGACGEFNVLEQLWTSRASPRTSRSRTCRGCSAPRASPRRSACCTTRSSAPATPRRASACAGSIHTTETTAATAARITSSLPVSPSRRKTATRADGPYPADTISPRKDGDVDAIVTMYHDQGQIAMKLMVLLKASRYTAGSRSDRDAGARHCVRDRGAQRRQYAGDEKRAGARRANGGRAHQGHALIPARALRARAPCRSLPASQSENRHVLRHPHRPENASAQVRAVYDDIKATRGPIGSTISGRSLPTIRPRSRASGTR